MIWVYTETKEFEYKKHDDEQCLKSLVIINTANVI